MKTIKISVTLSLKLRSYFPHESQITIKSQNRIIKGRIIGSEHSEQKFDSLLQIHQIGNTIIITKMLVAQYVLIYDYFSFIKNDIND